MSGQDLSKLLDTACRIGEQNQFEAARYAFEVRRLRGAIWHAVHLLKIGKVDKAREILQQQLVRFAKNVK